MSEKQLTPQQQLISKFTNQIGYYEKNNLSELLETHNISPSQFKQIVINELKKSSKMQQAFISNPSSLFASILLCAELGLNPSADVGEFYFLPFGTKITPILGYKGIISLILRSGEVSKIWSEIVYKDDVFEYELGLEPKLKHVPNLERTSDIIKYVYSVAKLNNGETVFKVMSRSEVEAIADMSKYKNELYGNSKKDPQGWMFKKTVIKQLSKTLPKDYYGKKGIGIDDRSEGGGYLTLDDENNVMFVESKNNTVKRTKSVYSNLALNSSNDILDIDVKDVDVVESVEPKTEKKQKAEKKEKKELTLELKTDTSDS